MIKERIRALIFFSVVMITCAIITVFYFHRITQNTFDECANHLIEIYTQVTKNLVQFAIQSWGCLSDWEAHMLHSEPSEVVQYIHSRRKFWRFSYFFFLNSDGSYIDIDGNRGKFSIENSFTTTLGKHQTVKNIPSKEAFVENSENCTVFFDKLHDNTQVAVAAINVHHNIFWGFEYDAIGVGYLNEDIIDLLNIDSFNGEASCFVVTSDGSVVLSTKPGTSIFKNYLKYLKSSSNLTANELDSIQKQWLPYSNDTISSPSTAVLIDTGKRNFVFSGIGTTRISGAGGTQFKYGVVQCKIGGEDSFLSFHNMNYGGFVVLGVVSEKVAGNNLRKTRDTTLFTLAQIFLLVGIFTFIEFHLRYKRQWQKSDIALKYKDLLFDILSTNVDDIFILVDGKTGTGEYISPNVSRLLGIKANAKDYLNIMSNDVIGSKNIIANKDIASIPIGDTASWDCEHTNYTTGEKRWYHETAYHVDIQNVDKFVFVLSDRTSEKAMMQKLEAALEVAKNANSAKSNFLSNMSHDIRTPMNAITGFTLLLTRYANDPAKVREYTKKISRSSTHLLSLINQVLDMSKIESGKTKLAIEPFSFTELLESLSIIHSEQAKAKGVTFEMHTKGRSIENLVGDKVRVAQIFTNLISNAVKYTPTGGKVDFIVENLPKTSPNFEHFLFTVKDNGIGMSAQFLKTLYEPFTREENFATRHIQGTGLGCSITKSFVDLMGGVITVESKEGMGTTFTVELSFAVPKGGTNESAEEFYKSHGISRALIVDDEIDICQSIVDTLNGTGITVDYRTSGAQAIIAVQTACNEKRDFSVILLDYKMPEMSGIECAKQIRKIVSKEVPILILTAYDWSEIESQAREAGIDAFMAKPFFATNFRNTIEAVKGTRPNTDQPQEQEDNTENYDISGMHFLVAEDNDLNAEILEEIIRLNAASAIITKDGSAAVETFQANPPGTFTAILMDIQMPIMDGYTATRTIRNLDRPDAQTIPIIAMTANAFAEDKEHALQSGMTAHIAKPIDVLNMRKTIYTIVNK